MILDLWTFDVGVSVDSPQDYAEECVRRVEESWNGGADIVLFPEFCWVGLAPFVRGADRLREVSRLFWSELLPAIRSRLAQPDKAAVLGTAPFWDEARGGLLNRAPILCGDRLIHQDKLHLTPWESAFAAGDTVTLWRFRGITVAVLICLDVEVPEIAASLRGRGVHLILVPSATETEMGTERIARCASARSVELGCWVGVAHLTGAAPSDLIDQNVGRLGFYRPSQADFAASPRTVESAIQANGFQRLRCEIDRHALEGMRAATDETNPSLLSCRTPTGEARKIEIAFEPGIS